MANRAESLCDVGISVRGLVTHKVSVLKVSNRSWKRDAARDAWRSLRLASTVARRSAILVNLVLLSLARQR